MKESIIKVYIAGIGPGNADFIIPHTMKIIKCCDVLVGGRRNLDLFKSLGKEEVPFGSDIEKICTYISENAENKMIVVLATGDPGIFSITQTLQRRLKDIKLEIIPGISSLQYLCSKTGLSWNDMAVISLHGRENNDAPDVFMKNRKTAVFTGGGTSPADVCKILLNKGIHNASVTVGERLSYPEERIVTGTPEEISQMSFDNLSLMIVENVSQGSCGGCWNYKTYGIPDHMFIREDVPMTKEEVRTIALSKLRLEENSVAYDIGAGTGSVSIECGLICRKGCVYAVERKKEAAGLIRKNIEKFRTDNVIVIEGDAPCVFEGLPPPDRVFIGGTGGHMDEILGWIAANTVKSRVVINAISPESLYDALKGFEKWDFKNIEIVNVSVSKGYKVSDRHIMKAMNPVYIISAQKEGYQ
jgi:precorrin-6B C5,15-methyltransferase / cobalt-precorrin-6B C5,C15-methyltransferase